MLSVPSLRLNQFGVNFYEALLSGADLQSLVAFEVLSFGAAAQTTRGKVKQTTSGRVNWELLERRISASEHAYQRPIIKKKIDELVAYYLQCADSGSLPAIPGSVLLVSEKRLEFIEHPLWRTYVFVYHEGEALLEQWLNAVPPDERPARFGRLLREQLSPGAIAAEIGATGTL